MARRRTTTAGAAANNIAGNNHNVGNPLAEDEWHHIAIVRSDDTPEDATDAAFSWDWYINGERSGGHSTSTNATTPNVDAGRRNGYHDGRVESLGCQ